MAVGVVAFNFDDWEERFPGLVPPVTQGQAQQYFEEAELILNNTPASPVRDLGKRKTLLYLLVAHLAQLFVTSAGGGAGASGGGMVGRVVSARRGSVSISTEALGTPASAAWFTQTQYGLTFWQMTAWLRQMRMLPGRPHPARIWP